jgi:HK97 family phage major capsid protein
MLRNLVLAKNIKDQRGELETLQAKDADYKAREESLAADIEAANTQEEREAVEAAVADYDKELQAHEEAKAKLTESIAALEKELNELEKPMPAPAQTGAEPKKERMITTMAPLTNIRTLAMNCRAFDTLPEAKQQSIMADPKTKEFIANVRAMRGVNASVTGADLAIPVSILPILNENRFRYSKLMNRVMVRTVRGEVHQPIGGLAPEAVWEDCCDALNELDFAYSMVALTCKKVGGFVLICNSLLQETDIDLLADLIEMISEALGKAKDKAILYGKGDAYSMPAGIVPRLAQQSKPDNYPVNAPEWVDLHSTHLISIAANLTGADFWAALRVAAGNTFTRYARGELSWCMNSKTYALLESKAIATSVTGEWVAIIGGRLPIVSGQIDVLEFMPDGDIVGGYFQLYLWAQHDSAFIGTDRTGLQLRVKDATLVFGRERADGMPLIPEGFVGININGQAVTTVMDFPANSANDAELEDLTIGTLTLSPSFDGGVTTYTAAAANGVAKAAVNATPAQFGAAVEISVTAGGTTKKVNNGAEAALAVGENVIAITVKQGNAVKVYTVTVTRAAS